MRRTVAIVLVLACAALLAPNSGGAAPHKRRFSLPAFTEVTVEAPASHGFHLSASATRIEFSPAELEKFTDPTPARSTSLFLELARGGEKVVYIPAATLSDGALKARLGNVGRVDLTFVPHRVTTEPIEKGCRGQRTLIEHGAFEGRLDFNGERGYSSLRRRRIPATLTRRRPLKCHLAPTEGKGPRGLRVEAGTLNGGTFVGFLARRTSAAGAGTDLSAATVEPPAPFRGTASFVAAGSKQTGSWLGPLSVSFPGRPDVRLAGKRFEGSVLKDEQCSADPGVQCIVFGSPGH